MTTSDWPLRMYRVPLSTMNQQQQRLTETLRSMDASPPTAIIAPAASSSNASGLTSSSWHAPYLKRVYWLLTNSHGHYLETMNGLHLSWVADPNAVPELHRYCSHQRAKAVWVRISNLLSSQNVGLAVRPVDFYAYPASPHLWCALDGQL